MFRRLARAIALLAPWVGALASRSISSAPAALPSERLESGSSIERSLAGTEHHYWLSLDEGECAQVSVLQRGLDVAVLASGPDGVLLGHFDEEQRDGLEEQAEFVATQPGIYTLTVKDALARPLAGTYAIRLVGTRAATSDDRARQALRQLRAEYTRVVGGAVARPLVERALMVAERSRGTDSLELAVVRLDLARNLQRAREYARAVTLFEQAASTFEIVLGAEHPATAEAWTSLAATYAWLGQRPKALSLAERALAVSERALGPGHPQVALCLITLANLRADAMDLELSEELLRRALTIVETRLGASRQLGVVLNNLGMLLISRQQFEQADPLLQRSLELQQRFDEDDVGLAITLQNLGVTARERRDYARAEDYYLQALDLRRKTLGPDHPDIALNLNNLATLYRATGRLSRALETHLQVLGLLEQNVGPYSGGVLTSLGNIARTYAAMGDVAHAIEYQRRVDAAIEAQLALHLATGSERQKLAFVDSLADRMDRSISLDADTHFNQPRATELAALAVLQRKGRVLDAMTDTFASVRRRLGSPEAQRLLDELAEATRDLARVALSDSRASSSAERLSAIQRLERRREALESSLSEGSAEFRAEAAPVTLDAIRAALPSDAALIELLAYRPFNPRAESNSTAYGAARYVAYVLTQRETWGLDLGPAAPIDEAVGSWRQALNDPQRADVSLLARQLDAAVMQPIRRLVPNQRHLLISPDGALNLIPFEALRDEQGRYGMERHLISYVSSGRDLLRLQATRHSQGEAVIVADPLFGEPATANGRRAQRPAAGARRSLTSVDDLAGAYFAPLRGTALEAQRIQALLPGATVLAREQATRLAVSQLKAPRVLHIATHGFFIRDPQRRIVNPL